MTAVPSAASAVFDVVGRFGVLDVVELSGMCCRTPTLSAWAHCIDVASSTRPGKRLSMRRSSRQGLPNALSDLAVIRRFGHRQRTGRFGVLDGVELPGMYCRDPVHRRSGDFYHNVSDASIILKRLSMRMSRQQEPSGVLPGVILGIAVGIRASSWI